jgi:predicted nucleic acid-binding protein
VKVYDARLVAVMQVYAVDAILTFNDGDFDRYSAIRAIRPAAASA